MKKTRHQEKCERTAKKLKPLSEKQTEYAYSHTPPFLLKWRGKTYCSECGREAKEGKCGCGAKFGKKTDIIQAKRKQATASWYFGITTTADGEQIHRHFIVTKKASIGEKPEYDNYECTRNFINEKGQIAVQSLQVKRHYWSWEWNTMSEIATQNVRSGRAKYSIHNITDWYEWPRATKAGWLQRRAPGKKAENWSWMDWTTSVLSRPMIEWLAKKGLTKLLEKTTVNNIESVKRELELAEKHGYKIKNIIEWADMVRMLRECGKDTLNGKWSRPDNEKEMHDRAIKMRKRKIEKERRMEALKHEEEYRKEKVMFFGMVLKGDNLKIRPIESVAEMQEEGDRMHHCVASYHKNKNSLILTARDWKENRIATIEWSLKEKRVIQCRGIKNCKPERYDEILETIDKGRREIEKRTKKWRRTA